MKLQDTIMQAAYAAQATEMAAGKSVAVTCLQLVQSAVADDSWR